MTTLLTLNTGDITYNYITYNQFYSKMTLLITVNKKIYSNSHFFML